MDACLALVSQIFAAPAQGVRPGQEGFDLAAAFSEPVVSGVVVNGLVVNGQWGHSSHCITITWIGVG